MDVAGKDDDTMHRIIHSRAQSEVLERYIMTPKTQARA